MKELKVVTNRRAEMLDITAEVNRLIPASMDSGVCHVFCTHTTAGLTVNENADPDVQRDILGALERLVPWGDPAYRHGEGNSAAHFESLHDGVFSDTAGQPGTPVHGHLAGALSV